MSKCKPLWWLGGSLVVISGLIWLLAVDQADDLTPAFAAMTLGAVAVLLVYRRPVPANGRFCVGLIWAVAIAARVCIWVVPPTLSDDIYRYKWDGRVQLAGINPYRFAPQDSRLALEHDSDFQEMNHKEIPTIYPPLAQFVFLVLAWIKASVWSYKAAFGLFDLLTGLLLWRHFHKPRGDLPAHSAGALALYLWHPLLITEYAGSGHLDSLWVCCFVAALILIQRKRWTWAAVAFAGAISAKLIALAFVPLFWRFTDTRRTLLALGVVIATYLPYAGAGFGLFAGLQAYSFFWQFNGFVFPIAALLPGGAVTARLLMPLIGGAAAWWIIRRTDDVWLAALATTVAMILLLPVNYPWYWGIMVALLYARPNVYLYLFTLALMATYQVLPAYYSDGTWELSVWVGIAEAVLLCAGAVMIVREMKKAGVGTPASEVAV